MPKRIIRLSEINSEHEGLLYGLSVRQRLDERLSSAFEDDPANPAPQDPLKLVISFEGVVDIGALVLDQMVDNIRRLYARDWYKYLTFTQLEVKGPVFRVLGSLLREENISIVCEPDALAFCGITEEDMSLRRRGPYHEEQWPVMRALIDYLYGLEDPPQANTTDIISALSRPYGDRTIRGLLTKLEQRGILVSRKAPSRNENIYSHVAKYDPDEIKG